MNRQELIASLHGNLLEDFDGAPFPDEVQAAFAVHLAGLECPAAKHHRMKKTHAPKMVSWDEFGPVMGLPELISDTCTACGFDFNG